jgi:hypothetical protein
MFVFETRGRKVRDRVSKVEKGCLLVERGRFFGIVDGDEKE